MSTFKSETSSSNDKSASDMEHISEYVNSLEPEEYEYLKKCCDNREEMYTSKGISTDIPDAKDQGEDPGGEKPNSKDKEFSLKDFEDEDSY